MTAPVNSDAMPPSGDFYVTVRDAGRFAVLCGPYADVRDALADVQPARTLACERDVRATFYSYGTSRLRIGAKVNPLLGRRPDHP